MMLNHFQAVHSAIDLGIPKNDMRVETNNLNEKPVEMFNEKLNEKLLEDDINGEIPAKKIRLDGEKSPENGNKLSNKSDIGK